MLKKILLKILLRLYVSHLDEIKKLPADIELKMYAFDKPEHVNEVLKHSMTVQTLWHFEAQTDFERACAKGAALFIKNLLAGHKKAVQLMLEESDDEMRLKKWLEFKKKNRIN